MMLRKVSLIFFKYLAILVCLITLLLSTPWGTQLSLRLINNINGVAIDYHSGSMIRDLKLHTVHLQLTSLDITIKELSTEFHFACILNKTLCIKAAKADYFSLRYIANDKEIDQVSIDENSIQEKTTNQLFDMPFSIDADSIELKESDLFINNNEISIDQLKIQLSAKKSQFNLFQPKAKRLTLTLDKGEAKAPTTNQGNLTTVDKTLTQLPEIHLPIALIIEQLKIDDIVIETKNNPQDDCQKACTQWLSSNNKLSGTWVHSDIRIRQFKTTTPTFSIKQLSAEAKLIPPYQISSQVISQLNEVPSWPEVANATQKISLQGSLEALSFDVISQGNLALSSQGRINLVHEQMPFNITLDVKKVPTPLSLSQYGSYSSLFLYLSGDLKKQSIDLTSQVEGYGYKKAQIKLMASHLKDQFSIDKFVFNDTDSASQLDLHGDLTILPTDITWQLSATSTGFSLPKINLPSLLELNKKQQQVDVLVANMPDSVTGRLQGKITTTGSWSNKQWSIALNDTHISGKVNDTDLNIEADIGLNHSGHLQQGNLLIDFNKSELILQAANNDYWDIKGQLTVDNFNNWYRGINGAFTSKFSVTGQKENPTIDFNSQFSQLHWQEFSSPFLAIKAIYQPLNNHQIHLTLNNDQLKWVKESKSFNVDNFNFNVEGNANLHQVNANWLGNSTGKFAITGHLNDDFSHWKSSFEKSKFTYLHAELQNNNIFDFDIDFAKQEILIGSHCWHGKGLNVCLPKQAIIGNSGDLLVNLNIDLSVIDELWLPKDIELISQLDGEINVNWSTKQAIKANAHLALSSGYLKVIDDFSEHQLSQWSQGIFTIAVNEQQLTNNFLLTGLNEGPLLNFTSTVDLINDYPIKAQIELNQFNLRPFQAILTEVVNLQGKLTANMSVAGTVKNPKLNGDITLGKGKLKLRQNANIFDNISTEITIKNNQVTLGGQFFIDDKVAKLQGNMSWKDNLTMNIDLTAETLPLLFPPQLVMNISPRLNFSLIEKTLTISGNIDVLNGTYNIEKLPESSVSLSDDVIIINSDGHALVKKSTGFDIKTNIRVNIDKALKIEGQGLKTHIFGQLQISQKEKHPFQLFGQIQSSDGTFKAYGQNLKIEKGEFTFNGPIDNPYFNLRASRYIKAQDIDVGIQITGLADALNMQLFSSRTMETPEMLSYLMRGRGLDTGTGNSSAAASLIVGFGVSNSFGLLEQIEKIPLINNVAVDTEGHGDKTQATVSGYVGNRVYLKYGIGVYEPINELTVRMFMFNRLWLEIVSGIEQSTDLYYSFDID